MEMTREEQLELIIRKKPNWCTPAPPIGSQFVRLDGPALHLMYCDAHNVADLSVHHRRIWFSRDEVEQAKRDMVDGLASNLPGPPPTSLYLPPVGVECEFMCTAKGKECSWTPGVPNYVSALTVVIGMPSGEFVAHPSTMKFRPIKSDCEKWCDSAMELIKQNYSEACRAAPKEYVENALGQLYRLMASGQLPLPKVNNDE